MIQSLPIEILPEDDQTVLATAHIKANHSVSYTDAFVVVATQNINGIIVTGNLEFEELTSFAKVEWLKKRNKKRYFT